MRRKRRDPSSPIPPPQSPKPPKSFSPEFVLNELHRIAEQDDVTQATKIRALELGMKYYGMLEDRLSITAESLSPTQRALRVQLLLDRAQSRILNDTADTSGASDLVADQPLHPTNTNK